MSLSSFARRSRISGSVNWAFVIVLFLLLIFIFLWYGAADERDQIKDKNAKFEKSYKEAAAQVDAAANAVENISAVLGFRTQTLNLGGRNVAISDVNAARQHLDKAGEVEVLQPDGSKVKEPGFLAKLWNLKIQIDQTARSGGNTGLTEKVVDLSQASPKFREALARIKALAGAVPPKPSVPVDPDDQAAMAKWKADMAAYTAAVEALKAAQTSFFADGEFVNERKKLSATIGLPATIDPDTWKSVEISFAPALDVPITTFEQALPLVGPVWDKLTGEFRANKGADRQSIEKLQADIAAERKVVVDQNKRYEDLQAVSKGEIDAKTRELEQANARASTNEQAARKAENDLQVQITERKKEVATLMSELTAHKARLASDKERRDLEIRRDEVDGRIVAVNHQLETGTIDLGSNAKVYPGLKFVVSYVDRGGARQPKGEVQVIEVTGEHSSKVRITSATQMLGTGDLLSNPFFNALNPIHIYTAGWTPDFLQRRRLEAMNVVLDAAPSAKTDYFVVPDDWKGGVAAPAEGGEEAAVGSSPLDKARQEANNFGAQLITRRMLEVFLKL